jgi:tRNA-specific 2-thiouridylase
VVGSHDGLANFTIGQRRGLGIAMGQPMYVAAIDPTAKVVTLGPREALLRRRLVGTDAKWLVDPPEGVFRAETQVRYRHAAAWAIVSLLEGGDVEVVFDEPQWAITPGQAVVFYNGDIVVGGAWIDASYDD